MSFVILVSKVIVLLKQINVMWSKHDWSPNSWWMTLGIKSIDRKVKFTLGEGSTAADV